MRRIMPFSSKGSSLVGTLDEAPGNVGLLIVSGGNETRVGAHRGMAMLAARLGAAGISVFRFDRSGVGDSSGPNRGYEGSLHDIFNAFLVFSNEIGHERIFGFGNCDAATALALFQPRLGLSGLILANPWTIDDDSDLPPPAAIRARYAAKIRDPYEWWRLVSGGVNLSKLLRGLRRSRTQTTTHLADRLKAALATLDVPVTILTARGDNTAIAFRNALPDVPVVERDSDSHSFAGSGDADWLFERIIEKLR